MQIVDQVREEFNRTEDVFNDTSIDNALKDIKEHLTKEELLCVALYKHSKRQRNDVYRVYLEKHYGKTLTCSGVSKRKTRTLKVLKAVGAMLTYKQSNGIDIRMRRLLTKRQYLIVSMYERRLPNNEIAEKTGVGTHRAVEMVWKRAIRRLYEKGDENLKTYLEYLKIVLRFSNKHPINSIKKT